MAVDDYSPRTVGDLANPLTVTLVDGIGKVYDLTGLLSSDFSLKLIPVEGGTTINCAGTISVLSPPSAGVVQYPWQAADVATVGLYYVRLKANVNGDGKPLTFLPKILEFLL
jgi:hypothetical protein